jgi:hypothetical protein
MADITNQDQEGAYRDKVAQLRAENARLRAELEKYSETHRPARLESAPPTTDQESSPAVSAQARATGQPMILGVSNSADQTTYLDSSGASGGLHVHAAAGRAVTGVGQADSGLFGYSYNSDAVVGQALPPNGRNGVRGQSHGFGVYGESTGGSVGVYGYSATGPGTYGFSNDGLGAVGVSINAIGSLAFSQQREAVNAFSVNADGVRASTSSGNAAAVFAENASGSASGVGVVGLGQSGIGVYASGAHAAIQLGRTPTAGPPTTDFHVAGEIVLDANADLYLCKATGTPGTWKLIG